MNGFYWTSRSHFYQEQESITEEIIVGISQLQPYTDHLCIQMKLVWLPGDPPILQLKVVFDSWCLLEHFQELLRELQAYPEEALTPERVVELLRKKGFTDHTPYAPSTIKK